MKTLLVLDNATAHKLSKVKDKIKEYEAALPVISNGLTWRLQQLGISLVKLYNKV